MALATHLGIGMNVARTSTKQLQLHQGVREKQRRKRIERKTQEFRRRGMGKREGEERNNCWQVAVDMPPRGLWSKWADMENDGPSNYRGLDFDQGRADDALRSTYVPHSHRMAK